MKYLSLLAALVLALAPVAAIAQAPAGYEQITVSTTAVGLASATIAPDGQPQRTWCILTLASQDIRWRADGVDPDTNTGHVMAAGASLELSGFTNLSRFRAIRDGASDGTLSATCGRDS